MKKYDGRTFAVFSSVLGSVHAQLSRKDVADTPMPEDVRQSFIPGMKNLTAHCEGIGLRLSVITANRILNALSNECNHRDIANMVNDLQARIQDELSTLVLINIPTSKSEYFEKPVLFGPHVLAQFPSAVYDIEEAGNCFALERYTACVMHLMRTLEVALNAIAVGLGIANLVGANRNWGNLLSKIKDKIDSNNIANPPLWASNKSFFENAYTHLNAVRVSWRNPTMHVENKYSEGEAEDILNAVKGLMRHLATKLDESGTITP